MDQPTPQSNPTPMPTTEQAPLSTPPTPVSNEKSSNSPVVATITVMVIIALGVTGFFFIKQNNTPEKVATTATIPTSTQTQPSPTIDPTDENAIESVDVGDTDASDLQKVEADIETL